MDDLFDDKLNEALKLAEEISNDQQDGAKKTDNTEVKQEEVIQRAPIPDEPQTTEPEKHKGKRKKEKVNAPKKLKDPWSTGKKITVAVIIVLFVLIVIPVAVIYAFSQKGKTQLTENVDNSAICFNEEGAPSKAVSYNGEKYLYNENVITVLVFGVDSTMSEDDETEDDASSDEENRNRDDDIAYYDESGAEYVTYGGRVDMCFLLVFDKETNKMNVISVNRDSMTDVNICTTEGEVALTDEMQLTLAYSYGDGGSVSCMNFTDAVSDLFYGLPINGYIAVDMEGVSDINDAVNGVTLLPIETVSDEVIESKSITLAGEQAYKYLERMDVGTDNIGENAKRIARQNQYFMTWVNRLLQCYDTNKQVLKDVYEAAKPYLMTNLDFYDMIYLAGYTYGMDFELSEIEEIPGEYERTDFFDEYRVDDEKIIELILKYFYTEVQE